MKPKTKPRNQNLIIACFVVFAILILLLRLFVFVHGHSRRTFRTARPTIGDLLLTPPNPPGLDKFPVDINRMIQVQQQPFAPIKKSQPEKVVINKSSRRIQNRIPDQSRQRLTRSSFVVE